MVARGLWLAGVTMPRTDAAGRHAIVQRWSTRMLRCLGVEVRTSGTAHAGAVLMVANHVSWLDIPALHASAPQARFVSKSDIARWPLLGNLARAGGTLFIERERKRDALRVVHEVADALRAVARGRRVSRRHHGRRASTCCRSTPTCCRRPSPRPRSCSPSCMRYSEPGHAVSVAAQYTGDDHARSQSLMKVCRARGLVVDVRFLPHLNPRASSTAARSRRVPAGAHLGRAAGDRRTRPEPRCCSAGGTAPCPFHR